MIRVSRCFLLLGLISPLSIAYALLTWAGEVDTSCPAGSGEYTSVFQAELLLNERFLPPSGPAREKAVESALLYQFNYVSGALHNVGHGANQGVAISSIPPRIRILSQTSTVYGLDLQIDEKPGLIPAVDDPYLVAAMKFGQTTAVDPAIRVRYEAEFRSAICVSTPSSVGLVNSNEQSVRLPLPLDPYLAYWYVRETARRIIRWNASVKSIPPCADTEFADIDHPYYYWYFWQPFASGEDQLHVPYDCKELLREGEHLTSVKLTWKRTEAPALPGAATAGFQDHPPKKPLRMTFFFGFVDHQAYHLSPRELRQNLTRALAQSGGADYRDDPLRKGRRVEGSSVQFINWVAELRHLLNRPRVRITQAEGGTVVTLTGKLPDNGQSVVIRSFLGATDVLAEEAPTHWALMKDALAKDEVIVYGGHAGLGANFSLESLAKYTNTSSDQIQKLIQARARRLIGIISCYSYSYFGDDFRQARPRGLDLILTGSPYTDFKAGAASVLNWVRQSLRGEAPKITADQPENFLIVTRD